MLRLYMFYKMITKGRNILIVLFLLHVSLIHAAKSLSNKAQFSFLVGAPNNSSVFSIFGHASLRIDDPELNIDYIFNYGVFDRSNIDNISQLIKGNLYCELWVYDTNEYMGRIRQAGIGLKEHVLNLLPEEKEALWQHLISIGKNRSGRYHYDILRSNCATLPRMSIEKALSGKIVYNDADYKPLGGYDDYCEPYLKPYPWIHFFAYFFFGNSIGNPLLFKESLFLPYNLEAAFQSAVIHSDSDSRPLIASSSVLVENFPEKISHGFFSPSVVGWILFAVILILSLIEWKKKSYFRALDFILFGIAGLFGIILFLLNTVFAEWYTIYGYHLLWLHPLHLLGIFFFVCKKFKRQAYYYHFINLIALLTGAIVLYNFGILERLLITVAPYMLTLGVRSIFGLIRRI